LSTRLQRAWIQLKILRVLDSFLSIEQVHACLNLKDVMHSVVSFGQADYLTIMPCSV